MTSDPFTAKSEGWAGAELAAALRDGTELEAT